MSTNSHDVLDAFLAQVPEMEEAPFTRAIRLALAADYPDMWPCERGDGEIMNYSMPGMVFGMALRYFDMDVVGDSITIRACRQMSNFVKVV